MWSFTALQYFRVEFALYKTVVVGWGCLEIPSNKVMDSDWDIVLVPLCKYVVTVESELLEVMTCYLRSSSYAE